jgi:hypothetical protein
MKINAFEVFIKNEKVTYKDWQELLEKTCQYDKRVIIEISFEFKQIEIYLFSKNDLSQIITNIGGFLLKPTDATLPEIANRKKINFRIPNNKNILETIEKEEIKKERFIEKIVIFSYKISSLKLYRLFVFLTNSRGERFFSSYFSLIPPFSIFEFDFEKNIKLKKKSFPLFIKIDEVRKFFNENSEEGFLEVSGFPYFPKNLYFPLKNFDLGKHTLIVGQTGVGKTKLIELLVKKIAQNKLFNDYCVVIIDPHTTLYSQFLTIPNAINFNFIQTSCSLFPSFSEPKISTELTILLFKTLLKDQFNAKIERVLKYVFYILFLKNQASLFNLKRFLTEIEFRKAILGKLGQEFDYLIQFFETEFVELQTKFYEVAIMPILVLIDELSFIPAFSKESLGELESVLKEKSLVCFSLNRIFLGEKAIKLIAGLIIQQLFLLAQKGSINKKIILIVDEVSLAENEGMSSILSEARKFNLSLFLSQQYLTQISPDLLKAILSNVFNYFVFKVSNEDAKILIKNLEMKFPDEILLKEKEKGISEEDLKRQMLTTLNPRECLARIFSEGKFYPCFKAKTLTV